MLTEQLPPAPLRKRLGLTLEVIATYVRVRRAQRGRELQETLTLLRDWAAANPLDAADAGRLPYAVRRIVQRLPGDGRCLVQSLVLVTALARRGTASVLVIGARTDPGFAAHAWVEHDGELLLPSRGGWGRLVEL